MTGTTADARAVEARLRTAIESGDFAPFADLYADGAVLEASLQGERARVTGPEAITERLGGWWGGPGRLVEWSPLPSPAGLALWLERLGDDGAAARQRHYVHASGGRITRHWVFAAPPRSGSGEHVAGAAPALDPALVARLGRVVKQEPITSIGWSGNALERIVLEDGRALVAKRIVPGSGWIERATADPGREGLLHTSGAFDRMPGAIDPATVAAERDGDAWWIVMRDVSSRLLDHDSTLTREQSHGILAAANEMWNEFWDSRFPFLANSADRIGFAGPAVGERERDGLDLLPKQFEAAWEAFAEAVDPDVCEAVLALVADPRPLAAELELHGTTLIHGDLRDENLALEDDRIILLDWGVATQGHPAVEFAWYLVHDAWRTDATHDEMVEDFRRVRGEQDDPRALELGMIAGLVMYGWIFGHCAIVHTDPAERSWAQWELGWWVPRVRRALETWAPSKGLS